MVSEPLLQAFANCFVPQVLYPCLDKRSLGERTGLLAIASFSIISTWFLVVWRALIAKSLQRKGKKNLVLIWLLVPSQGWSVSPKG